MANTYLNPTRARIPMPALTPFLAALTLLAQAGWGQACKLVQDQDFNRYAGAWQSYSKTMMESDFGPSEGPVKCLAGGTLSDNGDCTRNQTAKVGEGVLRGFYPKGRILGWESGFTWENPIEPSRAAVMEFKVKFEKGFDWTMGGKLPGFCGGGRCVAGCTDHTNQQKNFSTRLMWKENGTMITYPYWPENRSDCGGEWFWMDPRQPSTPLRLRADAWYTIRQELELGSADQRNSKLRIFVDDQLVLRRDDIKLITEAGATINTAYWTTYVGGSSISMFAPNHDQYIYFDDFRVWVDCPGRHLISSAGFREGFPVEKGHSFRYAFRQGRLAIPAQAHPGWVEATLLTAGGEKIETLSLREGEAVLNLERKGMHLLLVHHADGSRRTLRLMNL